MHAQPGDILIDDSVKHRKRWVKAGGIWVTHCSAEGTAAILDLRMTTDVAPSRSA
jgi:hypothetical protein